LQKQEVDMPEKQQVVKKYTPNRRVAAYRKSLDRGRTSSLRKERATARFARMVEQEDLLAREFSEAMSRRGLATPAWRQLLRSLGRGMAGAVSREPREHWPRLMAGMAVHRVLRGMDEDLVLECLVLGWSLLSGMPKDRAPVELEGEFHNQLASVREAGEGKGQSKPERPPMPAIVGSGAYRKVTKEFSREVKTQTVLEQVQERRATQCLREALRMIRPYARKVVVDRLADRLSYAELAERHGTTAEEVADIMEQARGFVRRYTTYFDDEWWWSDLPDGRSDKDEVPSTKDKATRGSEGDEVAHGQGEEEEGPGTEGSMAFPPQ
jgi:hypothetical protein